MQYPDQFKRGDAIEYRGCYVNALGRGKFLSYEIEGSTIWAVIRTNNAVHRVIAGDSLVAA